MNLKIPLLPMNLLKNRGYVVAVIAGTVAQMVYYSLNVLWPAQIASLYTTNNAMIGWISVSWLSTMLKRLDKKLTNLLLKCTTGASLVFGEIMAGLCFKMIGHYKWQLVFTTIGLTAFLGMMASTDQHTEARAIAVRISDGDLHIPYAN
jgi:hypothetical protein